MTTKEKEIPIKEEVKETKEEKEAKEWKETTGYYLVMRAELEFFLFSETEFAMYFDLDDREGTAKLNLSKHECSKVEDLEGGNRFTSKGRFLCDCHRWDSWLCNHNVNHAKSTAVAGYFGKYTPPLKLLGMLHLDGNFWDSE